MRRLQNNRRDTPLRWVVACLLKMTTVTVKPWSYDPAFWVYQTFMHF